MSGDAESRSDAPELHLRPYRQLIPRPTSAVVGGLAPWSAMPAAERRPIPLSLVVARLGAVMARPSDAPAHRPHAAVLVPLFDREGEAMVVLIRRSFSLAISPGDLAFPGGRLEPGEAPRDAALREADEEVGIGRDSVSVLGSLPLVERPTRGGAVLPYIGTLDAEPLLRPEPGEVEAVFTVALSDLAADAAYWEEEWQILGEGSRRLSFFADPQVLGDDVVWGMTAMLLRCLLTAVLAPEAAGG